MRPPNCYLFHSDIKVLGSVFLFQGLDKSYVWLGKQVSSQAQDMTIIEHENCGNTILDEGNISQSAARDPFIDMD